MARKGIYKRNNSTNWWIRYAGLDGRIIRKSTGTSKYSDAETMLYTVKKAVKEGKLPETVQIANHTFEELAEKYKAWVTGRQASAEVKGYVIDALVKRFGPLPLRRFNTSLVEQLQTDLMAKGFKEKSKKGMKAGGNNKVLNILRHMFSKAVEWEMVEAETLKRVRKVKLFREDKRLRFLSIEEAKALVSVCDEHLQPIVITALNTGMRRGEIFHLKWDNVDLQHGFILLSKTKNGERREIPINDTLRETLNGLPRRFAEVEKDGKKEKVLVPYVFHDPKTLRHYTDLKRSFASALKLVGITDFHFHDLRHTFASQLVMAGVDLVAVKELLGHKDIKMTLRYAHLAPAHKRKAVKVLDTLLNASPNCTPPTNCTFTDTQIEKESAYVS
jgi:integrase